MTRSNRFIWLIVAGVVGNIIGGILFAVWAHGTTTENDYLLNGPMVTTTHNAALLVFALIFATTASLALLPGLIAAGIRASGIWTDR